MERPIHEVYAVAKKLGVTRKVVNRRTWTEAELQTLRENYRAVPTGELADRLSRSVKAVCLAAMKEGLTKPAPRVSASDQKRIRQLVRLGWCNRCIGRDTRHARNCIREWRRRLGLPPITARGMTDCPVCKERTRATTREQCRKAGVSSLAEIRSQVLSKFAVERGWPAELPVRCVQILEILAVHGAMTRRMLVEKMGLDWASSRKAFKGRIGLLGGSYMTHLMHLGLVVPLGRPVKSTPVRQGGSVALYALTQLAIDMHREHHEQQERQERLTQHREQHADAGTVEDGGPPRQRAG